jgi:chorismate mutase
MEPIKPFEIIPLSGWINLQVPPLVVAGPCSAETEEQLLSTALALAKIKQVRIFRAGVWKPRTRPDLFEGAGSKALSWLRKVKSLTGLLTAVEVANKEHVAECLEQDVDVLWIGARTVIDPFAMQEIADAVHGVDIPVLVKNPVAPDLPSWIGALERLSEAGIKKIIAVHRGFYSPVTSLFRNMPMWEIPARLKRLFPGLPVICDPSHIAGRRDLIHDISQKALDMKMDGLMIETHIHPDKALTDAEQQITPRSLSILLSQLIMNREDDVTGPAGELAWLRLEIDRLDDELIRVLAERMQLVREIGAYKKEHHIPALQLKRWNDIISKRLQSGETSQLNRQFLLKLLQLIHEEALNIQRQ